MKENTQQADTNGQSLVFIHEVLLFAGAAIMLSVAYPRAEFIAAEPVVAAPAEIVPAVMETSIDSPAATNNEVTIIVADQSRPATDVMQPAAIGSTELTDVKQLLVAPEATTPLVPDTAADPAS